MEQISVYRLRKCSDIEMTYPYIEVLDQKGITFMDISRSDNGEFQILFYPEGASKQISLSLLENIINQAKKELE